MTYIDKGVDPLADEVVRLHGSAKRKAAAHAQTQRHPRSRKAALDRANLQAGLHAAPQTPKPLLKPHLPQPTIAHAHTLHTHTHTHTETTIANTQRSHKHKHTHNKHAQESNLFKEGADVCSDEHEGARGCALLSRDLANLWVNHDNIAHVLVCADDLCARRLRLRSLDRVLPVGRSRAVLRSLLGISADDLGAGGGIKQRASVGGFRR